MQTETIRIEKSLVELIDFRLQQISERLEKLSQNEGDENGTKQ